MLAVVLLTVYAHFLRHHLHVQVYFFLQITTPFYRHIFVIYWYLSFTLSSDLPIFKGQKKFRSRPTFNWSLKLMFQQFLVCIMEKAQLNTLC